jgi:hypothetical protein
MAFGQTRAEANIKVKSLNPRALDRSLVPKFCITCVIMKGNVKGHTKYSIESLHAAFQSQPLQRTYRRFVVIRE